MVRANYDRIDRDDLRRLADRIWHGAGEEIDRFVEIAMGDEPFPAQAPLLAAPAARARRVTCPE